MKLKSLLLPLLLVGLVSGCNKNDSPQNDEPMVIINDSDVVNVAKGSVGGALIDIDNGFFCEAESSYYCFFEPGSSKDKTMTIKCSNEASLGYEMIGTNTFKLITKKAGDSILTIYNSNGLVKYNHIVRVRSPYSPEKILDAVYQNDVYDSTGVYGSYRFAISDVDANPVSAVITGKEIEATTTTKAVFTLSYVGVADVESVFEGHFYEFNLTVDTDETTLEFDLKKIFISKCADQIMIYEGTDLELFEIFILGGPWVTYEN